MAEISKFLTAKDVQTVSNLQILARQVVEGFCTGLHRSPNKGYSVEFRQHRQYVHGDEIRHLDWKVYGKSDRFYIREYEEETNLRGTLLVDASGSMDYASEGISKLFYATRLAACLAHLMLQQADGVGLVTFDKKVRKFIPARSTAKHLSVCFDALESTKAGGETELSKVFKELVPKLQRRGLLVIISDCFADVPSLLKSLAHFRHAHHEIIIFQVWDRAELDFPFDRWTRFESMEDEAFHLIDPAHVKKNYMKRLEEFREQLTKGCHRHKVDLVPVVTDEPFAEALAKYLTLRSRR
ncbi:MAG: DUF58 domain-containing protein [Lentisphaeraceae bacterium]|nr:DUF58 domain-containing protein [Lentisphaeraceae bacterium]